MMFEMKLNDGR